MDFQLKSTILDQDGAFHSIHVYMPGQFPVKGNYPALNALSASVSLGTTSKASPTIP